MGKGGGGGRKGGGRGEGGMGVKVGEEGSIEGKREKEGGERREKV